MDIKDMLKMARQEKGLSINKAAAISYVSAAHISRIESGERKASPEILQKLSEAYGLEHKRLMHIAGYLKEESESQKKYKVDFVKIPFYDTSINYKPFLSLENVVDYINMPTEWIGKKCFALKIPDNSMNNSKIFEGDIVLVNTQESVRNGDIAVVMIDEEKPTIKSYYKNGSLITLIPHSASTSYAPIMIDNKKHKVEVLGKVVKVLVDI